MANSRCLASGGIIGVRHGANRESILVTVDGDGVSLYDANAQVAVQSWALGGAGASFTAPAVYAKPLKRFFASLNEPKGGGMVIRGWSSETVDSNPTATPTIQQSSTSIQLPLAAPPIFLHPLPKMDDGSDVSDHTPCLLLAHQDGAITLCNSVSVVSQDLSLQGYPLLTAKGVGNSLYTIHKDRKSSNAVLMQKLSVSPSGVITRLSLDALSPPGENVPALAAIVIVPRNVATTPSAVVLWSDFSISGYVPWSIHAGLGLDAISDAEPNVLETTEALFVRRLKGFLAAGQTKKSSSGGKSGGATPRRKRGHQQSQENSNFTNVGLVSAGDGVVLVAGWSIDNKDSKDSIDSLRLVSLDAMYGALLSAENIPFPSQNVDKGRPIQGYRLPQGFNNRKIVMAIGGCAVMTDLKKVESPTLASVVGSMSIPFSQNLRNRVPSSSALNLNYGAAMNGLDDKDLEGIKAPRVDVGTGLLELSSAPAVADERPGRPVVIQPLSGVEWVKSEGKSEKVEPLLKLWTAFSSGHKVKDVKPLIDLMLNKHSAVLSYDAVAMMLVCMAEHGLWEDMLKLLQIRNPRSLSRCGGVALAAALAQRYDVMDALLQGAVDIEAWELSALLRKLLQNSKKGRKNASRRGNAIKSPEGKYAKRIREKAETMVEAAERKGASSIDVSVAACCAAAVDGFSAAQICLHPLLSMNYDSSVLFDALKQLQSPILATRLVRYLTIWLHNYRCIVGEHNTNVTSSTSPLTLPGLKVIVEWLSLTLDVTLSSFMLRRESNQAIIRSLHEEVSAHVKVSKRFVAMKGPLDHLQRGAPVSLTQRSGGVLGQRYAIEWLSLKVGPQPV